VDNRKFSSWMILRRAAIERRDATDQPAGCRERLDRRHLRIGSHVDGPSGRMLWLEFGCIKGKKIATYFTAVRTGLNRNYEPMQQVFRDLICLALKVARKEKTS